MLFEYKRCIVFAMVCPYFISCELINYVTWLKDSTREIESTASTAVLVHYQLFA